MSSSNFGGERDVDVGELDAIADACVLRAARNWLLVVYSHPIIYFLIDSVILCVSATASNSLKMGTDDGDMSGKNVHQDASTTVLIDASGTSSCSRTDTRRRFHSRHVTASESSRFHW